MDEDVPATAAAAQPAAAAASPTSPRAQFVEALSRAFDAAPRGRQPCVQCMHDLFVGGKDPTLAGFVGAGRGLENHYRSLHRHVYGKGGKRSKCDTCDNWFATALMWKSHQKDLGLGLAGVARRVLHTGRHLLASLVEQGEDRDKDSVDELDDIVAASGVAREGGGDNGLRLILSQPGYQPQLVIAVSMPAFTQLSGINASHGTDP